jgi:hypothetical protein
MVKIFTMVKDEVDIVRDWIIYHASMFGYDNIYVIDNYSTDGTYEILQEYSNAIYVRREHDYGRKGEFMTELINNYCINNIAMPIDIDEFIVYYDNGISVDKNLIHNYLNNLPRNNIYKMNYIHSLITNNNGYERATVESEEGYYIDLHGIAKSFINTSYFRINMDHGNHLQTNDYFLTKLCLIHYHARNIEQIKKKIFNNITGLHYQNDLGYLKNLINTNPLCSGFHHVKNQINVLENNYILPKNEKSEGNIKLSVFSQRIKDGCF